MDIQFTKDELHFMMILLNEPKTDELIKEFNNHQWFSKQKTNIINKLNKASNE